MKNLAILYNPDHINHFWENHVERPERVFSFLEGLAFFLNEEDFGKVYFEGNSLKVYFEKELFILEGIENYLKLNHTESYIQKVKELCEKKEYGYFDLDTYFTPYTYKVSVEAVGSNIFSSFLKEYKYIFNVVRPPGHHALKDKAMGFCIFNNIAVLTRFLQKEGLDKIFILDFDAHHGNGTQDSFYYDENVFYFSTHFYPGFPGTGTLEENNNHIFNIPLDPDSSDEIFINVYKHFLEEKIESFKPQILLVSAGFDIHRDDPITPLQATEKTIEFIFLKIREISEKYNLKVIFTLEGGYNLNVLKNAGKLFGEIFKN